MLCVVKSKLASVSPPSLMGDLSVPHQSWLLDEASAMRHHAGQVLVGHTGFQFDLRFLAPAFSLGARCPLSFRGILPVGLSNPKVNPGCFLRRPGRSWHSPVSHVKIN